MYTGIHTCVMYVYKYVFDDIYNNSCVSSCLCMEIVGLILQLLILNYLLLMASCFLGALEA